MISLNNYEEYFFRSVEGELSAEEQLELIYFLSIHPELQSELDAFNSAVLVPDSSVEFPMKSRLLQDETDYNSLFVRYIENDLSKNELQEVNKLVAANPVLLNDLQHYQSTILKADVSDVYPDKKSLKKNEGRAIPIYIRYMAVASVAASLLFIAYMQGSNFLEFNNPVSTAQTENSVVNRFDSINEATKQSILPGANVLESSDLENQTPTTDLVPVKAQSNRSNKHQLIAQNSDPYSFAATNSVLDSRGDDMVMLSNNVDQSINYLPKERRVRYKVAPMNDAKKVSDAKKSSDLKSIAGVFGKELLRMSGRGDYLNSTSAFAGNSEKSPVDLSISGDKFKFNHKFFKKRSNSSLK